jgi:crotonobetainyl-CoA:carnitine CoA-transferase CaiB-like acyl-CoA transferase
LALEAGEGGRVIDVSMQAVLASRMDYVLAQMAAGDMPVGDSRHALDLGGPAGYFRCTDGYVYLWLSAPAHWEALGALLGQPAWMNDFPPRWLELDCTPERVALCRSELSQWLATQAKHTVSAEAQQLGITMVSVNQPADILACEQFAYRGFFSTLSHPVLGTAPYPGVPFKLSQTPARFERPAPSLGEHNA